MNNKANTMAARLLFFRTNVMNLSQHKLAKAIGLTQRAYAYYELGKSEPSRKTYMQLSKLGCDISWLITGKEARGVVEDNIQEKIEIATAEMAQAAKERNKLKAQIEVLKSIIDKPLPGEAGSHSSPPDPRYSELHSAIRLLYKEVRQLGNRFEAHVGG